MLNNKRCWCVGEVATPEELADKLTNYTWTLCTGFKIGNYAFLNDSFSEDGAQEYGVINLQTGRQIESITFSWCNYNKALQYIYSILEGHFDNNSCSIDAGINIKKQLQTPKQHKKCHLCM